MAIKTLYNPAMLSKDELVSNFVVRTKVFEKLFKDIKTSTMQYPEKHYLIQGQRGMGKTTLLLRLKYEIENTPKLRDWLVPVFFGEESYDLTSLSSLWEKTLAYLDDAWETGGEHGNHIETFVEFADYEKRCFEYLIEVLRNNGKKIILFLDNFGQLFLDNLTDKEKRRLREVLMNANEIRVIGASATIVNELYDYASPFYEFFNVVQLDGLDREEAFQLIERLHRLGGGKFEAAKSKATIDTLAVLSGGGVRTLIMVYQALLDGGGDTALQNLESVLDQLTPFYKHRIEDLPVQQRRIVDVIAKRWDSVSTKEIASRLRSDGKAMATKLVSAHLQQLEKGGVVIKLPVDNKNHVYQLQDRFLNIWYLMRVGDPASKQKVRWLVEYLQQLYGENTPASNLLADAGERYRAEGETIDWSLIGNDIQAGHYDRAYVQLNRVLEEASRILRTDMAQSWQLNGCLLMLMQRRQYHAVLKLFNDHEYLKDLLKPSYYGLMDLLKEEYPRAILGMGSELVEPVKRLRTML